MQRIRFCLVFFTITLCLSMVQALELAQTFKHAPERSFVVYAHKQTFTLTRIAKIVQHRLVLEEISAPMSRKPEKWHSWVSQGAPGHTSWTLTEVDLNTKSVISSYCLLKKMELNIKEFHSFLATLLSLEFEKVPLKNRKCLGVAGGSDDLMPRRLWQPKAPEGLISKGSAKYEAYQARWPKDGSQLAGQLVDLYFLSESKEAHESAFPHWIEVRHAAIKGSIFAISTGKDLSSPSSEPPRLLNSKKS
jgi:hypothetical protein